MMRDTLRPIKSEEDYATALNILEELFDAAEGTPEADRRDVLSVLIEKYEDEHYPIDLPDPIDAVKFRMDQAGLSQKDLVPLIGSKSKVSEVLAGKRPFSLRMIRALRQQLGIPADVLLGTRKLPEIDELSNLDFERFPVKEMYDNGAFRGLDIDDPTGKAEECIRFLISKIGGPHMIPAGLFRKSNSARLNANVSAQALQGWSLHVLAKAAEREKRGTFRKEAITSSFLKALAQLSVLDSGPAVAQEMLATNGILVVVVPHLKKTYLDGAAFLPQEDRAVIGLTLRYDRLDNFWFTLFHEIGHIVKHLSSGSFIADDMSLRGNSTDTNVETEADQFAVKHLLPDDFDLAGMISSSNEEVREYASAHNIHPAIVAGHLRYERNDYKAYWNLLGNGEVRRCFVE